jgi:hypothetical protein
MHRRFGLLLFCSAMAAAALAPQAARAAGAACLSGPAALGPEAVSSFMAEPSSLLARNPLGGQALANEVRSLVASDVDSADSVIALAATQSAPVQAAIGRGLASAAKACVTAFPELAAALQEKVAASGLAPMQASFVAASEDVATAALDEAAAVLPLDAVVPGAGAVPIGGDAATAAGGTETASTAGSGGVALTAAGPIANPAASSGSLGDGTSFLSGLAATDNGGSSGSSASSPSDSAPLSPTR